MMVAKSANFSFSRIDIETSWKEVCYMQGAIFPFVAKIRLRVLGFACHNATAANR